MLITCFVQNFVIGSPQRWHQTGENDIWNKVAWIKFPACTWIASSFLLAMTGYMYRHCEERNNPEKPDYQSIAKLVIDSPQRWHQRGEKWQKKKISFAPQAKQTHWLYFIGTFWTKWRIAQLAYLLLRCDSSLRSEWQGMKDRKPVCH